MHIMLKYVFHLCNTMHIMPLDNSIVHDRQTKTKELRANIEEGAKIGLHKL